MKLEHALTYCRRLTKEHSSTFYLGSLLFADKQRQAVHVVYAVCRSGDDAVDEASHADEARERLAAWWQGVERAFEGAPDEENPLELGLSWVLESYPLPHEAFAELHEGFRTDIDCESMESLHELLLYCRRVAGVVGWLVAPIAGYRGGEGTLKQALALGQAMQLTNILRDVGEDLSLGRCYLPGDLLENHGVEMADLKAGRIGENYIALLEELAALAHDLYRQGWRGIPKLNRPAAAAVAVAALNYEGILYKLRQNSYDNLTKRAHLKSYERLVLIPRAVYGVYGGVYGRSVA
jgi:15-cis-phytoene synthase